MSLSNILMIPGVGGDLQEIRGLLFGNGQAGWMGFPSLDNTAISANTLGSGIETFRDLYRGNNGTQATADQRSAWGRVPKSGRTNLYERTENIDNAYWTKTSTTVVNNFVSATSGTDRQVRSPFFSGLSTTPHTHRIRIIPAGGLRWVYGLPGLGNSVVWFDLQTVTVGTTQAGISNASITFDGSVYTITYTSTGIGTNRIIGLADADNSNSYTHDTGRGVTIVSVQMNAGTSILPYQLITTAFDITEPGQSSCYYLQPDGLDDGYVTGANLDLSGTDKVTVFAAVRKLSDAAVSIAAEFSPDLNSNNGSWYILSPDSPGASTYTFGSKGTILASRSASGFTAPVTNIITGIGDISGDTSSIRVNGVQTNTLTDQGTGNYGNYPLYLFRRGGTTLPFNGQCFASIVAGGSYSTATIQRVEQILSKYTPGVTL